MLGYDLVIKGGSVVDPATGVHKADIGIRGEKIAALAETISASEGAQVVDATNRYVFPGAIDSTTT